MYQCDLNYLKKEIEVNLHRQKQLWTRQQAMKFLKLLNIHPILNQHFEVLSINGQKLFTPKYGTTYLRQHLQLQLNENTYLPIFKLMMIVHWMCQEQNGIWNVSQSQHSYSLIQGNSFATQQNRDNPEILTASKSKEKRIEFSESVIEKLIQQFQDLEWESEKGIADLTSDQVEQIIINIKQEKYLKPISQFHIDGFSLIYTLMDQDILEEMKNYYTQDQLNTIQELAKLFTFMYYRLKAKQHSSMHSLQDCDPQMLSQTTLKSQNSTYDLITIGSSKKLDSNTSSKELIDMDILRKPSEDSIDPRERSPTDNSQLEFDTLIEQATKDESARKSFIRDSQRNRMSEVQYSQLGVSECAVSERGSQIFADSVIMDSFMPEELGACNKGRYTSSTQDTSTLKQLKQISPMMPFNLLNLEPLQWIRITKLPTSTSRCLNQTNSIDENPPNQENSQTTEKSDLVGEKFSPSKKMKNPEQVETKILSLKGAKLGRHKQNDFCYPDQNTISGMHAQVYFNGGFNWIQDVGSKTGTFIRILDPIILKDECCIQLASQVELSIKIIKREPNQGLIKIEFNKPQNFQGYRIPLKSGCSIKIGRSQDSHIKIDEKRTKVSEKHAFIKYQDQKFWFIDRKSTGGSWLRLSKKSEKSQGYKLSIGDIFRISYRKSFIVEEIKQMNFLGTT